MTKNTNSYNKNKAFFKNDYAEILIDDPLPPTGFLRLPQVLALIPVSKSTWWDGCKEGIFPKSVTLGKRITAWKVEDIVAYIESVGVEVKTEGSE